MLIKIDHSNLETFEKTNVCEFCVFSIFFFVIDTAYGINCYDGQWHYFDDSSVSLSDASSPVVSLIFVLGVCYEGG